MILVGHQSVRKRYQKGRLRAMTPLGNIMMLDQGRRDFPDM